MKSVEDIHARWVRKAHRGYVDGEAKSEYIAEVISDFASTGSEVLEVGCNVGRNLNNLLKYGFTNVYGVEINPNTEAVSREAFGDIWKLFDDETLSAKIIYDSLENYFKPSVFEELKFINPYRHWGPQSFDVIFSMSVFEHVHPESEWVFDEFKKFFIHKDAVLITVEDELNKDNLDFVFARNYQDVFESRGFTQVDEYDCAHVEGFKEGYVCRVFKCV